MRSTADITILPITERAGLREALAALHSANVRYENAQRAKLELLNIIGNPMRVDPRSRDVHNGPAPARQQIASRRDVAQARVQLPGADLEILEAEMALEDAKAAVEALRVTARADVEAEVRELIRSVTPAVARGLSAAQTAHVELQQVVDQAQRAGVDVRAEVLAFFLSGLGTPSLPSGPGLNEGLEEIADPKSGEPWREGRRRFWQRKPLSITPGLDGTQQPTATEEYLARLNRGGWLAPTDDAAFRASFVSDDEAE